MIGMAETAKQFFEACEAGKGWESCKAYCHPDATFSAQADAVADIGTVEDYAGWMQGVLQAMPDADCEIRSLAVDADREAVSVFAVLRGTHTGEAGPVPPTNRSTVSEYVYVMEFEDGRIRHLTKVWNDLHSMRELGWA